MIQHEVNNFDDISIIASELTLDGIQIECLTGVTHKSTATISSNRIANGSNIADNAHRNPIELSLTIVVSRTPTEEYQDDTHGSIGDNRPAEFYYSLLQLQDEKKLCDVQTALLYYKNMFITNISAPEVVDDNNSIEFSLDLQEADLVEIQTVVYGAQKPTKAEYAKKASRLNNKGRQVQVQQQPITTTNSDFLNNNYAKVQSYAQQFGF